MQYMGGKVTKTKKEDKKNKTNNICQKCGSLNGTNYAKYIRTFDYHKLPEKYFYKPEGHEEALLKTSGISENDLYPDYWIHLPKTLMVTKYPYKVCEKCYYIEKHEKLEVWNEWQKIK